MAIKILFSIAVHESQECVDDLIQNIKKFVLNPMIVLHVSREFDYKLKEQYKSFVFVNPVSYYTGHTDGSLIFVHFSNLKFFVNNVGFADYFVPFASNQLFIKEGIECFLKDNGNVYVSDKERLHDKWQYPSFLRDPLFTRLLREKKIKKCSPEGLYFKFDALWEEVKIILKDQEYIKIEQSIYLSKYGVKHRRISLFVKKVFIKLGLENHTPKIFRRFTYATEEIVLPSIIGNDKGGSISCFFPLTRPGYRVTKDDIIKIRSDLNSPFYSVKRVERYIQDPVRTYIKRLDFK